jgi:single-stranded-DNA-specific exonuclease
LTLNSIYGIIGYNVKRGDEEISNWIQRKPKEEYFLFDEILEKLRCVNGISDLEEWLNPSEKSLHNPFLLKNIKEVALKIIKATEENMNICISYDCDSDGLTSGTIMYRYLKNFTDNITYIYNQREDGHGISNQIVPEDTQLLIICDSSTSETEACKELSEKGIDIIILDHHKKSQENPYALIVNSQLCNYENKELSGATVAYKTIQVIDELTSNEYSEQYIDLAGIGSYSDVVSMKYPENRYFVYNGINNIYNPGIRALLKQAKVNLNEINSQTIGYKIGPNINAACRMGCIEKIVELLLENDYEKCLILAKEIINLNEDRKKIETKLYKKIKDRIDLSRNIIVIKITEEDDFSSGFHGLICTKITNKYSKPSLIVKIKDGVCSGSGRSVSGVNFKSILEKTKLCDWVNGHDLAFGVQFKEENLDKIYEAVEDKIIYNENQIYYYDLELDEDEVDHSLIRDLDKFNLLSGKDAPDTKILIKNCTVLERKVQGKLEDTIKIVSDKINFVKFRTNENYAEELTEGKRFDAIGSLKINKWFNNTKGIKRWQEDLQMFLEDYRVCEE